MAVVRRRWDRGHPLSSAISSGTWVLVVVQIYPPWLAGEPIAWAVMNYDWQTLASGVHRCRLPFLDVTVGLVRGRDGIALIDCGTTLSEAAFIVSDVRELTGSAVSLLVRFGYGQRRRIGNHWPLWTLWRQICPRSAHRRSR